MEDTLVTDGGLVEDQMDTGRDLVEHVNEDDAIMPEHTRENLESTYFNENQRASNENSAVNDNVLMANSVIDSVTNSVIDSTPSLVTNTVADNVRDGRTDNAIDSITVSASETVTGSITNNASNSVTSPALECSTDAVIINVIPNITDSVTVSATDNATDNKIVSVTESTLVDNLSEILSEDKVDLVESLDITNQRPKNDPDDGLTEANASGSIGVKNFNKHRGIDDSDSYDSSDDSSSSDVAIADDSADCSDSDDCKWISSKQKEKRDVEKKHGPLTNGELTLDKLPSIEELKIEVDENVRMEEVGHIHSIIGALVMVQAVKVKTALNLDTILFLAERKILGQVFETWGPVISPFYSVRFNREAEIAERGIEVGAAVFYAPDMSQFTHYVFIEQLKQMKGSDASWLDNNEPPEQHLDYSDDEKERKAKAKRRGKATESDPEDIDSSDSDSKSEIHSGVKRGRGNTRPGNRGRGARNRFEERFTGKQRHQSNHHPSYTEQRGRGGNNRMNPFFNPISEPSSGRYFGVMGEASSQSHDGSRGGSRSGTKGQSRDQNRGATRGQIWDQSRGETRDFASGQISGGAWGQTNGGNRSETMDLTRGGSRDLTQNGTGWSRSEKSSSQSIPVNHPVVDVTKPPPMFNNQPFIPPSPNQSTYVNRPPPCASNQSNFAASPSFSQLSQAPSVNSSLFGAPPSFTQLSRGPPPVNQSLFSGPPPFSQSNQTPSVSPFSGFNTSLPPPNCPVNMPPPGYNIPPTNFVRPNLAPNLFSNNLPPSSIAPPGFSVSLPIFGSTNPPGFIPRPSPVAPSRFSFVAPQFGAQAGFGSPPPPPSI